MTDTTPMPAPCRRCQALCKCTEGCSVAADWIRKEAKKWGYSDEEIEQMKRFVGI